MPSSCYLRVRGDRISGLGEAKGREGAAPDPLALQDFAKQVIAPYKYPRVVRFLPELPRTSTGKLQRFVLRDRAATRETTPDEAGGR